MAFFALLIVSVAVAVEQEPDGQVNSKAVDKFLDRVRTSLESLRSLLKKLEAHEFPTISLPEITGENLKLSLNVANLKVVGASDFVISDNATIYEDQAVKFTIWVPQLTIQGQYGASGVSNGEKIYGQGNFWVVFTMIQIHARAVLGGPHGIVEVTDVDFSFRIHDVKLYSDGLTGEKSSNQQINDRVSDYMMKVASNYNQTMAKKIAAALKAIANAFLTGRGLLGVLLQLKQFSNFSLRLGNFSLV